MSVNEIGEEFVFSDDESDTLFISARKHDPDAIENIKSFSHMLGNAGEEFIASASLADAEPLDMGDFVFAGEDTFDLDLVLATATAEDASQSSFPISEALPEIAENSIDLDQLFDVMQISAVPSYSHSVDLELSAPDAVTDTAREMTMLDSSSLPVSFLDSLDPSAGVDDLFKKLVLADES